jgi:hypothetical protein
MPTNLNLDLRRLLPTGRYGWLIRTPGFTSGEVRDRLNTIPTDARGRAVARCAAQIDAWLPPAPHFVDCPQHAWQHLPRIVFWYTRGDALDEIAARIGSLTVAWGVERALDVACARMARSLNRNPDAYGLPRCAWDNTHFPRLGRR